VVKPPRMTPPRPGADARETTMRETAAREGAQIMTPREGAQIMTPREGAQTMTPREGAQTMNRPPSQTPLNDAALVCAARQVIEARVTGPAAPQLQTVAAGGLKARTMRVDAVEVGADGAERTEFIAVKTLFNPNCNAVVRLWDAGLIDDLGLKLAFVFAATLDKILGAHRVRTVSFERALTVFAGAGENAHGPARESAIEARARFDAAEAALGRRSFMMMNLVMRYDMASKDAAAEVFRRAGHEKKLRGMGDALLIEAVERLAVAWGYKSTETGFGGG